MPVPSVFPKNVSTVPSSSSGQKSPKVELATRIAQGTLDSRYQPLVIERTRTIHWPEGPKTDTKLLVYPAEPKN